MQVIYGYYMVVYRPYTVRIPHWQTMTESPSEFQRIHRSISAGSAAVRWAVGCGNSPRWIHRWWWKSGSFRASALPSTWGAWQAWQGPARLASGFFVGPPRGCFPPMPHQFPRYLQHVKPRSCHICNILEPLEGNCSILELETDGKSSILELETLISAGIGIVWS